MKSFKVGDRVRIVDGDFLYKEATVICIDEWDWQDKPVKNGSVPCGAVCYLLCVDGVGDTYPDDPNSEIAAFGYDIEPIVNPDETAWTEFKRYLQPDPAVILAKEPA